MKNKKKIAAYVISSIAIMLLSILMFVFVSSRKDERQPSGKLAPSPSRSHDDMKSIEQYNASPEFKKKLEDVTSGMDRRIEFYGKVIDHRGDPVVGARVGYIVTTTMQVWGGTHDPFAETWTDERGEFKVERKSGDSLSIRSIEKDGYRFVTQGKSFGYGFGRSSPGAHQPDPKHPVEFLLIPSEFGFESVIRPLIAPLSFNWNSGPVEVPIGKTGEVLILRPTRDRKEGEKKGFAWRVEIEIKNGMLLMRKKGDKIPLAPLTGYQGNVVVGYERGELEWGGMFRDGRFIFKTSDGKYGRMDLTINATYEDGSGGTLASFGFNPTGERFLD